MNVGDGIAQAVVENPNFIQSLVGRIADLVRVKISFDDSAWDGSASRWDTAEEYCSDCLIDLNEAGQSKTKDKCKLPYRNPGSSEPNLGALRAIASGARGLSAVNAPAEAKRAVAKKVAGWWRSAFKKDPPPSIARLASGDSMKSVLFFKDAKGDPWFFGIYSNKWEDRDEEILSSDSHQEYADWVNKSGFSPAITLYHQPSVPENFWKAVFEKYGDDIPSLNRIIDHVYDKAGFARVRHVAFFNGFATVLAKIREEKQDMVDRLSEIEDLGMSHGFIALKIDGNVLERYRAFEMSVLKRDRAANLLTTAFILQGENDTMAQKMKLTDEDRKVLAQVMGEDNASQLDVNTEEAEKILDMVIAFKGSSEDAPPSEVEVEPVEEEVSGESVEEPAVEETAAPSEEIKAFAGEVKTIFDQIAENMTTMATQMGELTTKIASMESALAEKADAADVKALGATEDEKVSSRFLPSYVFGQGFSPAQSEKTEITKQEATQEKSNGPTGERGQVDPDNVIQIGLWDQIPRVPTH